jgi:RHS repeat-associated protein
MTGISSKALAFGNPDNKRKYNGIEFDNDLDLNSYEAFFRNLDPQTGRWWQIDPEIENMEAWSPYASNYDNSITYNDPLGDEPDGGGSDDPPTRSAWQGIKEGLVNFVTGAATPPIVSLTRITMSALNGDFKAAATFLAPSIGKADDAVAFVKGDAQTRWKIATENGLEIGSAFLGEKIIKIKGVEIKTPEVKSPELIKAEQRAARLSENPRSGKDFTKAGKDAVKDVNKAKNNGQTVCEKCGVKTTPSEQSKAGVTPKKTETQVDHVDPKSKGGSGTPNNGQVLCRGCNINKSNN